MTYDFTISLICEISEQNKEKQRETERHKPQNRLYEFLDFKL